MVTDPSLAAAAQHLYGQSSSPADITCSVPVETALDVLDKVQDWLLRSPDSRATVLQGLELLEV